MKDINTLVWSKPGLSLNMWKGDLNPLFLSQAGLLPKLSWVFQYLSPTSPDKKKTQQRFITVKSETPLHLEAAGQDTPGRQRWQEATL